MRLGWPVWVCCLIFSLQMMACPTGYAAEDVAATQILQPDGTPAGSAEVRFGQGMFSSVRLVDGGYVSKDLIATDLKRLYSQLPSDGRLVVPAELKADFVLITNTHGFVRLATSQIGELATVQMEPWTTARVQHVASGAPVAGSRVRIMNALSHDRLFQGMQLIAEATTDESGWAVFEKLPSGECAIQVGLSEAPAGRPETNQRMKYVNLESDADNSVVMGDGGRDVVGRIYLPPGFERSTFSRLRGTIQRADGAYNSIPLQIDGQGLFRAENVPIGPVKVEIRTDFATQELRGYYGAQRFSCTEEGQELDGRLLLGTVRLENRLQPAAEAPAAYERQELVDEFSANNQVAFMMRSTAEGRNQYHLYDGKGALIRNVDDFEASVAWLSGNRLSVVDPLRQQCYGLSNQDASGQWLVVFDAQGRQQFRIFLDTGSNRMAVDEQNGNLWLQGLKSLNNGKLSILSPRGELVDAQVKSGFSLCYSSMDKAFWMVGKSIEKIDAQSRRVLAVLDLPEGVYSCADVVAAPDGGCYALEVHHPDVPTSRNRIWHVDGAGREIGRLQLGNFRVNSLQVVGKELWLLGSPVRGLFTWESSGQLRRTSLDLQPLSESAANFSLLEASLGDGPWGFEDGQLVKLSLNPNGQVVIAGP